MTDCVSCGTPLRVCNEKLEATGHGCCNWDEHPLESVPTRDGLTRLDELEHQFAVWQGVVEELHSENRHLVERLALHVIWRTELNRELSLMAARIVALEEAQASHEALQDRLGDREELLIQMKQIQEGLPDRVDLLDRYLADIEQRLKLRRRDPYAEPDQGSSPLSS
jgi:hypothetical protein